MSEVQAISWDDHKSRTIVRSITWNDRKSPRLLGAVLVAIGAMLATSTLNQAAQGAPRLVSVIVRAQSGQEAAAVQRVQQMGGTVVRRINVIDGLVAQLPAASVATLSSSSSIAEVTADSPLQLLSSSYEPTGDPNSLYSLEGMDGARAYWDAGYTGQSVDVALIDSGVAPVDGLSARGKVVNGPDLSFESQNRSLRYLDTYGHGTNMAGIIAGRDDAVSRVSADDTTHFLGMAPGARIVSLKVADAHGQTDVSQMLAAIDWVVEHRADDGLNIRVLNLSFGTASSQGYQLDPLAFAAEQAWKHGIVVVVSAGNSGNNSTQLEDPAFDPYVLAVAASDTESSAKVATHQPASFTSRGTDKRKPDLAAPGVHVPSLRVPGSFIDRQYGSTATVGGRFFRGSGTSEAAAVVSGAVALLLSQRPGLTPDQVKKMLVEKSSAIQGDDNLVGHGELNLGKVLKADPPNATQSWATSTGKGSIESSRGGYHVVDASGVELSGERDIFGKALNTAALAAATKDESTWDCGVFNGVQWAGSGWSGSSWSAVRWSESDWAGSAWATGSWSTGSWSDGAWSTGSWSDDAWATGSWSTGSWSAADWS